MAVSDFVVLRGGLTVPLAPVLLLLDLERRGFKVFRDAEDIVIEPWSRLTDDDRAALKRWKPHVLALLVYTPSDRHLFDDPAHARPDDARERTA